MFIPSHEAAYPPDPKLQLQPISNHSVCPVYNGNNNNNKNNSTDLTVNT